MDLSFLNHTEYILDIWTGYVSDNPAALALASLLVGPTICTHLPLQYISKTRTTAARAATTAQYGINTDSLSEGVVRICRNMKQTLENFADHSPQFDDITMLCLKDCGTSSEHQHSREALS